MGLVNQLFPDIVKEAQDVQISIGLNESRQKDTKIKIDILRRTYSQNVSDVDFEYFQKEEVKLVEEFRKLGAANAKLQQNFRTLTNRVRILQQATKDYEERK